MDLFILDSQLRRTAVLDRYESLIWTERYSAMGDFEFVIYSTLEVRNLLVPGTRLAINESTRIMTVETVEDKTDLEGRTILTVKGSSLEKILQDRTARDVTNLPPNVKWDLSGTPAAIARKIFQEICVDGDIHVGDIIPFYTTGSLYPANTIPEPSTSIDISLDPTTVYDAIKAICDTYDLGFRLYRNGDTSQLMFNIYSGDDRTTLQSTLPAVIFSPELDNLADVSYLTSSSLYKNVAYVISPLGSAWVHASGVDPSIAGFDRKVLTLYASDVTTYPDRPYTLNTDWLTAIKKAQGNANALKEHQDALGNLAGKRRLTSAELTLINFIITDAAALLTTTEEGYITDARDQNTAYNATEDAWLLSVLGQKGTEALASNSNLAAFDGEVPPNSQYKYHLHYELGDIIEIRNSDKVTNQMRVTEQIFVSDSQGDRAYPTLTVKLLITPGSWYAYDAGGVWDDAVGYWEDY